MYTETQQDQVERSPDCERSYGPRRGLPRVGSWVYYVLIALMPRRQEKWWDPELSSLARKEAYYIIAAEHHQLLVSNPAKGQTPRGSSEGDSRTLSV